MSSFSAEWLALREPADRAARSEPLTRTFAGAIDAGRDLLVVDLAAGTGANRRYLSQWLPEARWRLVDRDARLLELAARNATPGVHTMVADLTRLDDPAVFAGSDVVTASAFLDLVSSDWLTSLAGRCVEGQVAAVLFALTYDGRIVFAPADEGDETARSLVNAHQRRDKGFGPALGPEAPARTLEAFSARGYHVERDRSDWRLGPGDGALQRELIEGWARAASELRPDHRAALAAWRDRRLAHVREGRSLVTVGHEDVAAWLRGRGSNSRAR